MSFLSQIDPTATRTLPFTKTSDGKVKFLPYVPPPTHTVGAIPIIKRALKLLDEVNLPARLRNHYRSRIAKYSRESLLRALVFKLENLKLENIKVKSQRALYNYMPKQCELHLNVWQARNNANTKGRASFDRDGTLFVLAKTIRVVIPVTVFENLGTEPARQAVGTADRVRGPQHAPRNRHRLGRVGRRGGGGRGKQASVCFLVHIVCA